MALGDLLWACPDCGHARAWEGDAGTRRCGACGRSYRRGAGGDIVVRDASGREATQAAAALVDRLPPVDPASEGQGEPRARVRCAPAVGFSPVRQDGRVLGFFERRGEWAAGELTLQAEALRFTPDGVGAGRDAGEDAAGAAHGAEPPGGHLEWPLEHITAVQSSSRTLQIKPRGAPVVSFRFEDASCRHWEQLIAAALQALYHRRGWGRIREYQPRIVAEGAAR